MDFRKIQIFSSYQHAHKDFYQNKNGSHFKNIKFFVHSRLMFCRSDTQTDDYVCCTCGSVFQDFDDASDHCSDTEFDTESDDD